MFLLKSVRDGSHQLTMYFKLKHQWNEPRLSNCGHKRPRTGSGGFKFVPWKSAGIWTALSFSKKTTSLVFPSLWKVCRAPTCPEPCPFPWLVFLSRFLYLWKPVRSCLRDTFETTGGFAADWVLTVPYHCILCHFVFLCEIVFFYSRL